MELENINSKQQKEHNMFLNSFSTEIEYQRELEIEIEKLQTELSHLQEENKKLLNDVLAKTSHLEELQKDMSVLCSEKESIKEEVAAGIEKVI
jgi:chromosome segregation ATPase